MNLEKIIKEIYNKYLNEEKVQSKKSNLSDNLWELVNSEYFIRWSNNWRNVLLDENNEPAIFYRGISLFKGEKINWKFNKSFFTKDKSYAQIYALNNDDGSSNEDLVFSFFLKYKNIVYIDEYAKYKGLKIDGDQIKTKFYRDKEYFKDYDKFLFDFNKADIICGDEDGGNNYSFYVKKDENVLPIKKLIEFVEKEDL